MKYLLLIFLLLSQHTFAQCIGNNEQCAPVGEWELSLAMGAGVLTNPLQGGSNIPLVLVPNISYYGNKIFFENNALGYSFSESDDFSFSAISLINREKSFFTRWHPSNVFIPSISNDLSNATPGFEGTGTDNGNTDNTEQDTILSSIDLNAVAQRKWALDAGAQANWFISPQSHLTIQLLHDVTNTYNGFNGKIEFNHRFSAFNIANMQWRLTAGVNWLSQQQVDYYYGLSKKDNVDKEHFYQGKSALNPYIKLSSAYKLNNNWRLTFTARSEFLSSSIHRSPLVKDEMLKTIFVGVVYAY